MNNQNNLNKINNSKLFVLILQIVSLTNAVMLGWRIKKVEGNKFIICKKIDQLTELDNNTSKFLDTIMQFREIDY